jgi:hypothetical protein
MPQLHFYVSDELAEKIRQRAKASRLSVSKYLAGLIKKEVGSGWPEGYFETVVGGWKGEPLERPPQGELETRHDL